MRSRADASFDRPTSRVPCRSWRWRLVASTTSRVDEPDVADARGREVECGGRAEPAGADDEDTRGLEAGLAGGSDLGEREVARVAEAFLAGEVRRVGAHRAR